METSYIVLIVLIIVILIIISVVFGLKYKKNKEFEAQELLVKIQNGKTTETPTK